MKLIKLSVVFLILPLFAYGKYEICPAGYEVGIIFSDIKMDFPPQSSAEDCLSQVQQGLVSQGWDRTCNQAHGIMFAKGGAGNVYNVWLREYAGVICNYSDNPEGWTPWINPMTVVCCTPRN